MSNVAIPHDIDPHPLTGMYNGKFGIWLFLASEVMLFGALFSTYVLLRVGAAPGEWPRGDSILSVPLATINTGVLISSSVTMVLAWANLKMHQLGKAQLFLTVTFLLAGTFLVIKFFEYQSKFTHYMVVLNEPITVHDESVTKVTGHLGEANDDFIMLSPDEKKGEHGKAAEEHGHEAEIKIDRANIKRLTTFSPQASTFLATYFTLTGLHGLHVIGGMVVILYWMLTGSSQWKRNPTKYTNRVECTGLYWHFVDLVWIFLFPVLYLL